MVRLPRTARDVIRRLASPPLILQRGIRLSRTATALTPAEKHHVEHVLGVGRIALCATSLPASASGPATNAFFLFFLFSIIAAAHVWRLSGCERDPLYWKLVVDNDGRPFEFAGRLTLAELEAARRGPLVIKERVRQLGGDLAIESGDRGVCLDILIPRRTAPERQKTA